MASSNIEELLALAAALYVGVEARQMLRRRGPELAPQDQEIILKACARRKLDFIPKTHSEGEKAHRLLVSLGNFCREKTFVPNAPYAPGVTGVRLAHSELERLRSNPKTYGEQGALMQRVVSECVAENLLLTRPSSASTARESGTIFYLNRTLCASFDLPLQLGGWQEVSAVDLIDWMTRGRTASNRIWMDR